MLALCLFLSGVAALTYETVWTRLLTYSFSGTTVTSSLVLSAFMGGMAVGSWLFGRWAARMRDPLKAYVLLELGLAFWGIVMPSLLGSVGALYIRIARSLAVTSELLALKSLMFVAVLSVPAILMGATLPVAVRLWGATSRGVGTGFSVLYAVNSLGAVVGTISSGFWMIQNAGLLATSSLGAVANVLAAIAAITLRLSGSPAFHPANAPGAAGDALTLPPASPVPAPEPRGGNLWPLALFVSGFTAMGYEVLWARVLPLVLGSSTYSVALMLATFISGITLGSLAFGPVSRRVSPPAVFALSQGAVGIWILLTIPFYSGLPALFLLVRSLLGHSFAVYELAAVLTNGTAMFVPAFLFGLGLPAAVAAATGPADEPSSSVGRLYAANTIGNVIGSVTVGLVLVPLLGTPVTFQMCALVNVACGAALLGSGPTPRFGPPVVWLAAAVLAAFLAWPGSRAWLGSLATSGVSRQRARSVGDALSTIRRGFGQKIEWLQEDPVTVVAITRDADTRALWVSGKIDASDTGDLPTQVLLSQLPLLVHRDPRTVFILGLGTGVTAGAALSHPVSQVHCAEISPSVVTAAVNYAAVNGSPWKDPRFVLSVDDGRHLLQLQDRRYDVIVLEPSNPWMIGMTNLFTVEFLAECARHLNRGGLLLQWMHLYEVDQASVKLVLRTLRSVFPHVRVFRAGFDLLILGAQEPETLDGKQVVPRLVRRMQDPRIRPWLARARATRPLTLLASELFDTASLSRWVGRDFLLTDDFPALEFMAPVAYYQGGGAVALPNTQRPFPDSWVLGHLAGRNPTADELVEYARFRLHYGDLNGLSAILTQAGTEGSPELSLMVARTFAREGNLAQALPWFKLASDQNPNDLATARSYLETARSVESERWSPFQPNRHVASREAAARVRRLDARNPGAHLILAETALESREEAQAEQVLVEAAGLLASASPSYREKAASLWVGLARSWAAGGRIAPARQALEAALRLAPDHEDARALREELSRP